MASQKVCPNVIFSEKKNRPLKDEGERNCDIEERTLHANVLEASQARNYPLVRVTPPTTSTTQGETVHRTIFPYHLTAADRFGAVISHPLLTGNSYDEWACGFKKALTSPKKFGFLDGSIARLAEGSPDLDDWCLIQALLLSWIRMMIDPVLRSNISYLDVAKDP